MTERKDSRHNYLQYLNPTVYVMQY